MRALAQTLATAGHQVYLVGGCVRDLLQGRAASDFDLTTSAPQPALLELLPRAIPIGVHHGTVMVPTSGGPVDITPFRSGARIEDDLAHRDFTVNAVAYDVIASTLLDPFNGRSDLSKARLRAVGSAAERFSEDPLRALRAARLVSTLGLTHDAEIEHAMSEARGALRGVARQRVRHELSVMMLGPSVEAGLDLLRRTGIEQDLTPGVSADAAAVVAALPWDLEIRLAGWLRGTRAGQILRRNRFPRRVSARVEHLVELHPIDSGSTKDPDVRRLIRRAGEEDTEALVALRNVELRHGEPSRDPGAAETREHLRSLEEAIERVRQRGHLALQRLDLALDGRAVMKRLGCGPGPHVGEALAHLTDQVVEDPSRNSPEALGALLDEWASRHEA